MELEGSMKPILLLSGYDYAAKKQDRIIQVFQASRKLYAFITWKPRFAILDQIT